MSTNKAAPLYDYQHQAWVEDGAYIRCGHEDACPCYGTAHVGERALLTRCPSCNHYFAREDFPFHAAEHTEQS